LHRLSHCYGTDIISVISRYRFGVPLFGCGDAARSASPDFSYVTLSPILEFIFWQHLDLGQGDQCSWACLGGGNQRGRRIVCDGTALISINADTAFKINELTKT
jgi:hypothetical protein